MVRVRNLRGEEGRGISHFDPFAEEARPTVSSQMATTGKPALTKIDLKLLMDKSRKRVLFAEAGKEFVDFLFGLLELPLGSVLKLLVERGMVKPWSMSRVYESVQSLDNIYLQPEQTKFPLLQPKIPSSNTKPTPLLQELAYGGQMFTETFLLPPSGNSSAFSSGNSSTFSSGNCSTSSFGPGCSFPSTSGNSSTLFGSGFSFPSISGNSSTLFGSGCSFPSTSGNSSTLFGSGCSSPSTSGNSSTLFRSGCSFRSTSGNSSTLFGSGCSFPSTSGNSSTFWSGNSSTPSSGPGFSLGPTFAGAAPSLKVNGYVREIVTYMVMDDLTVKPMSTVTSITVLNTLQVRDIGCLEEKMVKVDMEKALKLVKASFESTTVLTDVFLSEEV